MARAERRLPANAPGPFFVDASCIDCGTCWQFDPLHFSPTGFSAHVQLPSLEQTLAFSRRSPGL